MEVKAVLTVLGAKFFKGAIEGQNHDTTKLFVAMPVSEKDQETYGKCGHHAIDIKFGKSDEYAKLKSLPFPVQAELSLELTTDGYECVGFKALSHAKPAQPAN